MDGKEKLCVALTLQVIESIADRLDIIGDRYEQLFDRSEKFFKDMKAQFMQEIIKEAVDLELKKTKKMGGGRIAEDVIRKTGTGRAKH